MSQDPSSMPGGPIGPPPVPPPGGMPPGPVIVRNRLPALLVLLGGLIFLLVLPYIAEQLQYSLTRGRLRAESEVAREELAQLPESANLGLLAGKQNHWAVKAVEPSVVGVKMIRLLNSRGRGLGDEWSAEAMEGLGSGVIVDPAGFILTNFHVINGADQITVTLPDGRSFRNVDVVGTDPGTDIAVLKISGSGLIAAALGNSDHLQTGDPVLAVGSPYGLAQTVTAGIVSAKERHGLPVPGNIIYQDFLQTDAAVNPGNSGGPLVNLKGEVVGINTAIFGHAYQGISFAIPSNLAKTVYDKLKAGEKITRGWLGVQMEPLTEADAKDLNLPDTRGALIKMVLRDSPAEKAGMEPRDVVVEWNGKPVDNVNDLRFRVAGTAPGTQVKVVVVRDGQKKDLTVTVGERPSRVER